MARHVQILVVGFALVLGWVPGLFGQTRFTWPDTPVNFQRYTTVEECLAAAERVQDSVERRAVVLRDTTPLVRTEDLQPLDPAIVRTARACANQFEPDRVPLTDWTLVLRLYLFANRDDAAMHIMERELHTIDSSIVLQDTTPLDSVSAALVWKATDVMLSVTPKRDSVARLLLARLVRHNTQYSVFVRARWLDQLMTIAMARSDTTQLLATAHAVVDLAQQLTAIDKGKQTAYPMFRATHLRALQYLTQRVQLESLARSTPAYIALRRANERQANERLIPLLGELAPRVTGDFWFAYPDDHTQDSATRLTAPVERPRRDRPSLIVALDQRCGAQSVSLPDRVPHFSCWDTYAILRRLAQRFPTLEITLVSQTMGYFWPLPPMPPAQEAEMLNQWWLGFHRLPGTLAVTTTPFWRLDDPDRRRIDQETTWEASYEVGSGNRRRKSKVAVLVDPDGLVVEITTLDREHEPELQELIDVLVRR